MHNRFSIRNFHRIQHPSVLACADIAYAGLTLRGLKLVRNRQGEFLLGTPGRKIDGRWQVLIQIEDRTMEEQLVDLLLERYQERAA